MLRVSSLILLLAVSAFGQEQFFSIRQFRGLNTVASDFTIQPGEARQCHNIDLGKSVGALTRREGHFWDANYWMAGDSIMGIL